RPTSPPPRPPADLLPAWSAQRQALAERRLIDLDNADASRFQIRHLIADRQRQLPGLLLAADILPRKRPHQHGHRTGQHALHYLVGLLLGIADPVHSHGFGATQITKDDGGFDAARTIALHPAEPGKGIAI